jgi:hypothetical protein
VTHPYQALRTITVLCKATAAAALIVALTMAGLIQAFAVDHVVGAALGVVTIIAGTVGTLMLCAIAEGIRVIIDIERNTRSVAYGEHGTHAEDVGVRKAA